MAPSDSLRTGLRFHALRLYAAALPRWVSGRVSPVPDPAVDAFRPLYPGRKRCCVCEFFAPLIAFAH